MILMMFACVIVLTGCGADKGISIISAEEAKATVDDFINNTLLPQGQKAIIEEITEEFGLYKLVVKIDGQEEAITSYLTKDGKKFFPAVPMDIEETKRASEADLAKSGETPPLAVAPKSDKPKVELFVMSHCPFGTQAEKGILPVVEALGDKIDFEFKFCDYVMHGKKEIDEQLNQVCIQKEYPEEINSYLTCFLENETYSSKCMKDNGISESKISSCVAKTDKEFKITEMYDDKSTWASGRFPKFEVNGSEAREYGVGGSPSLVINGVKINSGRAPSIYLKTICDTFNDVPEECSVELSSANPSAGFGFGEGGAASDASCGS